MRARAVAARRKVARKKILAMRRTRSPEPVSEPVPIKVGRSEYRETGL